MYTSNSDEHLDATAIIAKNKAQHIGSAAVGKTPLGSAGASTEKIQTINFYSSSIFARNKLLVLASIFVLIGVLAATVNAQANIQKKKATQQAAVAQAAANAKKAGLTTSSAPSQTGAKTPTATQKTAPAAQKVVAQAPQTTIPTQSLPQLPVNNTSSPPYVGSLPDTVSVYNTGGFSFYYAGGRQFANATGASVSLTQAQPVVPELPTAENHSLMELAGLSADGRQIVEIGWVVDKTMNGDELPHLFVYHWVDGQTSCYNACGFVQVSSTVFPGQEVASGTTGNYQINYSGGNWNMDYNGTTVGYFPASLWPGNFTQIGFVQVFGEVAKSNNYSSQCIPMGNGILGSSSGSARISNFALIGSSTANALSPFATASSNYAYGFASGTGVNIGGPGTC